MGSQLDGDESAEQISEPFLCGDESAEQISEAFLCCVCLDLLYKPIVLACGHVSCFWCVHRSMNGLHESHCPICRHPYNHFPTICQMLHFLFVKMYPVAYKRRDIQILEEEKKTGFFSPSFDDRLCVPRTYEEWNDLDDQKHSSATSYPENLSANLVSVKIRESCTNKDSPESIAFVQDNSLTVSEKITTDSSESTCSVDVGENNLPQRCSGRISPQVSIVDVLCAACKQLLFRPAVLNCGHVYCETCIIPSDETIRCQVCESPHPGGLPKVCLEFDHFLEDQFPFDYAARRDNVRLKQVQLQHERPSTCSSEASKQGFQLSVPIDENFLQWWGDHGSNLHIGIGCDSCGMFPIVGDRYRCMDCKEAIGFDLCGDCYNTRSKLPGRFNQQHTPDHKFELQSNGTRNILLRLLRGQLEGSPDLAPYLSDDASEMSESVFQFSISSDNAEENAEIDVVAPSSSSGGTDEPQKDDDSQRTA